MFLHSVRFCYRAENNVNKRISLCFICNNNLSMTEVEMTGSQEKELNWLCLIDLKDDMKFSPQNLSAVKGQNPWLCP